MHHRLLKVVVTLLLLRLSPAALAQITEQPDPLRPSVPAPPPRKAPARTDTSARDTVATTRPDSLARADTSKLIKPADTPIFRYRVTTEGTFTTGNVDRALFQITSAFDYELSRRMKVSTTPSFVYGRQNGLLNEREFFADVRSTYLYENRLYYLAFGSLERSNLRKIRVRYTAAAGIGYKLLNRKRAYLSITNVLLRERTDFIEGADFAIWRNSARLFGEYTFGADRWSVTHTVFYQPALGVPNVRWNGSLSVQTRVTALVSLRTSVVSSYESVVAPGRERYDVRWVVGMVIEKK